MMVRGKRREEEERERAAMVRGKRREEDERKRAAAGEAEGGREGGGEEGGERGEWEEKEGGEGKLVEKFDFRVIASKNTAHGLTPPELDVLLSLSLIPRDLHEYYARGQGRDGKRNLEKKFNKHGWEIRNVGLK